MCTSYYAFTILYNIYHSPDLSNETNFPSSLLFNPSTAFHDASIGVVVLSSTALAIFITDVATKGDIDRFFICSSTLRRVDEDGVEKLCMDDVNMIVM